MARWSTAEPYLRAALQEQGFEPPAASHQGLDAILRHLVAPGDIQLFQQRAPLAWEAKGKACGSLLFYEDILLRGRTRNSPVLGPTRALMHTHTPRGMLPRQTPPGVSSFPEALSGALEQGIRRAKQGQRTPFWAPPSPTHTVYALSGPKHNQTACSQSQKSGCSPPRCL